MSVLRDAREREERERADLLTNWHICMSVCFTAWWLFPAFAAVYMLTCVHPVCPHLSFLSSFSPLTSLSHSFSADIIENHVLLPLLSRVGKVRAEALLTVLGKLAAKADEDTLVEVFLPGQPERERERREEEVLVGRRERKRKGMVGRWREEREIWVHRERDWPGAQPSSKKAESNA